MDIKKYIKNKDIELTNDDLDIEKLENDLRKGYELSSEIEKKVSSAVAEANNTSKSAYSELETKYNDLQAKYDDIEKRNTDITERNRTLSLENVMTREGFKDEDFKDISSMRYSMYGEIKDDREAISKIKEKFQNTYFPSQEPPKVKDDLPINNGVITPQEPLVTRKTNIKDIVKK
jgi:regulator of replication initiation timing